MRSNDDSACVRSTSNSGTKIDVLAASPLQVDDRPFVRQEPEAGEVREVRRIEERVAARADRVRAQAAGRGDQRARRARSRCVGVALGQCNELGGFDDRRLLLDLHQLRRRIACDAVLGELPRGHEEPRLERADRLVERADRGVEVPADLREVAGEDAEPVVELATELRDLRVRSRRPSPAASRTRRCAAARSALPATRSPRRLRLPPRAASRPGRAPRGTAPRRRTSRRTRARVELPPVALLAELGDVVAQLPRVARKVRSLQLGVLAVDRVEVRLDRHL